MLVKKKNMVEYSVECMRLLIVQFDSWHCLRIGYLVSFFMYSLVFILFDDVDAI